MSVAPRHSSDAHALDWPAVLDAVLRAPGGCAILLQPIVDLRLGETVGYEALARFEAPFAATPDTWFAAARQHGCEVELGLLALRAALAVRRRLPPECFFSLNLDPELLVLPSVADELAAEGDLQGVLIEVTEHTIVRDYAAVSGALERYRAAGAAISVDDAGAGYASMAHILALRPQYVKLDRALVAGCDHDPARAALVAALAGFCADLDARVIAEGIEREAELDALIRLRVPLGQGYLFGQPAAAPALLPEPLAHHVRERSALHLQGETIAEIVEPAPTVAQGEEVRDRFAHAGRPDVVVELNNDRVPQALWFLRSGEPARQREMLRVLPASDAREVARRAMLRARAPRFDPVICVDEDGRYAGIVRMERLIELLAAD